MNKMLIFIMVQFQSFHNNTLMPSKTFKFPSNYDVTL